MNYLIGQSTSGSLTTDTILQIDTTKYMFLKHIPLGVAYTDINNLLTGSQVIKCTMSTKNINFNYFKLYAVKKLSTDKNFVYEPGDYIELVGLQNSIFHAPLAETQTYEIPLKQCGSISYKYIVAMACDVNGALINIQRKPSAISDVRVINVPSIVNNISIKHFGVQGEPGLVFFINGEPFILGRNGKFETPPEIGHSGKTLAITSFGVYDPNNRGFIADYEYKIIGG